MTEYRVTTAPKPLPHPAVRQPAIPTRKARLPSTPSHPFRKCKTDLNGEADEKGTNIYRSLLCAWLVTGVISPNPQNNPVTKV